RRPFTRCSGLRTNPTAFDAQRAALRISKGQFLCPFDGCSITARFDVGPIEEYLCLPGKDGRTDTVFIDDYAHFAAMLKWSKRLHLEAPLHQHGNQVLEFDVSGLAWEDSVGKKNK